jgi:hypothetical protein
VGLVVSIIPACVEMHLWWRGIDTMGRSNCPQGACQGVVCFVVLVVFALGDVRMLRTEVASGPVLFHVQPPSLWRSAGCRVVAATQYPRESRPVLPSIAHT